VLPTNDEERKKIRLSAIFTLFPKACVALAKHIKAGADKWCGGQLRWDRTKSPEELESLLRHVFEQVQNPTCIETAQAIAWRAMANLEKVIEASELASPVPECDTIGRANLPADVASFLDSEGCLDEFVVELAGKALPRNRCDWIATAFTWQDAPSGRDFWSEVDNRWLAHLDAMQRHDVPAMEDAV
jgi:hypothetical protein